MRTIPDPHTPVHTQTSTTTTITITIIAGLKIYPMEYSDGPLNKGYVIPCDNEYPAVCDHAHSGLETLQRA